MGMFRRNFRRWWQPPRKSGVQAEERTVSFLELFYDLVYVVIVAELAHTLASNVTLDGVLAFAFLFIIVWWAWFNGSSYHDYHGNIDIRTRFFTFLQIFTVAAMAVFAHNALGDGSAGFALSYAAFQIILTYLWWRTGVHDPDHRPFSRPYSVLFLLTTLLFIGSVFVDPPIRFYFWGVALLVSLMMPLNNFRVRATNPAIYEQSGRVVAISPALVERFGLLTIIVLGEVIAGTIRGMAQRDELTWLVGLTAVLGILIAIGLWWIYFDFISHRRPRVTVRAVILWGYLHLPMTAGIIATGAAVSNIVEHTGEPLGAGVPWLLVGAIALTLLCTAGLMRAIQIPEALANAYRTGGFVTLGSSVIILLLGFIGLNIIPLLILVIVLLLSPVFYGLKIWIRLLDSDELVLH